MVMAWVCAGLVMERTEFVVRHREPSSHAEMHDEDLIRRQGKRQELRLAAQMGDTRTAEAFGEPVGEGKP